jgi:hypothetical protein
MLKKLCFNKNVRKMFSTTDYDLCVIGGGPAGINILTKVTSLQSKLVKKGLKQSVLRKEEH